MVAIEAQAIVAVPPGAAAPVAERGGAGRPAKRAAGEGGTPDANEPRSEEGEGASATGLVCTLAPMRLNSNFSAAAGQPEMSDQGRC